MRPPNPTDLLAAQNKFRTIKRVDRERRDDEDDNENEDEDNEDDEDNNTKCRKKRNADGPKAPTPTTIKYYPGAWKTVLHRAKDQFQYYVAVLNAFPDCQTDLDDAATVLRDTINDFEHPEDLDPSSAFVFTFSMI